MSDTAAISVDTDEAAQIYYAVTASATQPANTAIVAGSVSGGLTYGNGAQASPGTKNFTATGLTTSGTRYVHFTGVDAAGNVSDVATSSGWTQTGSVSGYALVAHNKGASNNSPVTSTALNSTGANLIVVAISQWSDAPDGIGTLTDSESNSWTALTSHANDGCISKLYYCISPTVGSGHTFTFSNGSGTGIYGTIAALAFSRTSTPVFDSQSGSSANIAAGLTSIQTGSITPALDNALIIAAIGVAGTSISVNSGFTITESVDAVSGGVEGIAAAYLIQGTAAAVNPTFSWTTISQVGTSIAVFK